MWSFHILLIMFVTEGPRWANLFANCNLETDHALLRSGADGPANHFGQNGQDDQQQDWSDHQ